MQGTRSNVTTPSRPGPQPGCVVATFLEFTRPGHIRIMPPRGSLIRSQICPSHPLKDFAPATLPSPSNRYFISGSIQICCNSSHVSPFTIAQVSALPFSKTPADVVITRSLLFLCSALNPFQLNFHSYHCTKPSRQ